MHNTPRLPMPLVRIGIGVMLLALAGSAYIVFSKVSAPPEFKTTPENGALQITDVVPFTPETTPASRGGWRTYTNDAFRFKISYPRDYEAREYTEADGAMSLTVQSNETGEGFQLYVVPYTESQVTEERFRLDSPSGIMKEPVDVVIAGVRGTMFWSKNSLMGDTREVWFINNGFLYEVVTYKHLDTWLAEIMQTWEFLLKEKIGG